MMGVRVAKPVVLDACVLVPQSLCDLLLRLAEDPELYRPIWTEEILNEAHRALTHRLPKSWPKADADRWRSAIRRAFPEAGVCPSEDLMAKVSNHAGDRHVLAAAIDSGAQEIVTYNLRHFKAEDLNPWKIKALNPDDFLLGLHSIHPELVVTKIGQMGRRYSDNKTLELLNRHVPAFVSRIRSERRPEGG